MGKQLACFLLFRLLLPISLFAASIVRYNGFSLTYLLLLLVLPLIPGARPNTMTGHTGRYLIFVTVLSGLMLIAQVIFQGVLLGMATDSHPYGTLFSNCSIAEKALRQVGFQRLDPEDALNIVRVVVPDIVVFTVGLIVTITCFRLLPVAEPLIGQTQQPSMARIRIKTHTTRVVNYLGHVLVAVLLALSGIALPSLLSATYFLSFLALATWWGCYRSLGKKFAVVKLILLIYSALHLILLYLYQFQFFQDVLHPENFYARLFGITGVIKTDCDKPWLVSFHQNKWPVFANPAIILLLYIILAVETRRWCQKSSTNSESNTNLLGTSPRRRNTRHSGTSERQSLIEDGQRRASYSSMERPHTEGAPPRRRLSRGVSRQSGALSKQTSVVESTAPGPRQRSFFNSIFTYIMKQSYATSLIIMMVWSITYHSWLTFVFLLTACIIWMIPAKRKVCLVCSPLIVSYAEGLLLIQYIYGFNLKELPTVTSSGYEFSEIGLETYKYPCLPLGVQVIYTFFFWLTLRQYMRETQQKAQADEQQGLPLRRVSEPEVGATGSIPGTPTMQQHDETEAEQNIETRPLSQLSTQVSHRASLDTVDGYDSDTVKAIGRWFWHLFCKYWIIVCAVLFLVIAVQEAVIYRIIYLILFCYFVITFKLCYNFWRWTILVFWWVTIMYSMFVLILLYTYQFKYVPDYWRNITGFNDEILNDIGLQQFDTATLFVKLLTPTSFLILIILQLYYFQTPFLRISDISRYTFEERSGLAEDSKKTDGTVGETGDNADGARTRAIDSGESAAHKKNWKDKTLLWMKRSWDTCSAHMDNLSTLLWRVAEVHWLKILAFVIFLACLVEVSAVNVVFVLFLVIGLPIPQLHFTMSALCLIWAAIGMLAKMMFQLKIIQHDYWNSNCSTVNGSQFPFNGTIDNADYLGLLTTSDLGNYLLNYIFIVVVIAFEGIIWVHQKQHYGNDQAPNVGIIFPQVKREQADRGLIDCLKFLANYTFYKFGLEICFVMTVITMVIRLDAYSLVYGFLLGVLLLLSRRACFIVWPAYIIILAVILAIQYLACLGVPPGICWDYPWMDVMTRNLQIYLYLPNYTYGPDAYKLIADFFQLLFVCLQWRVFFRENSSRVEEYGGGDNKSVLQDVEANKANPVDDFLSCKDSYLDYIKTMVFQYMFWVTLVLVFIAGTTRISLFCMGYLLGVFYFLWFGQEMLIKPLGKLLKLWGILLGYNYFVIVCKCALQLVGCVYFKSLEKNYCWLVQLLSIVCLRSGHYIQTDGKTSECLLLEDEAGLTWDTLCFVMLLFQLRIYKSHYFRHVVTELTVINKLAARGAQLINTNLIKSVEDRKAKEAEVLTNIKRKMERIKMRQQKLHAKTTLIDAEDHYSIIRSGDYYMFEGDSDEDMESVDQLDTMDLSKGMTPQTDAKVGPLEILNAAMTKGTKAGLDKAQQRTPDEDAQEKLIPEEDEESPQTPSTDRPTTLDLATPDSKPDQTPSTPKASTSAEPETDGADEQGSLEDSQEGAKEGICAQIMNGLKLTWALVGSFLDTLIGVLEDISREYREVAKILDEEKEAEKKKLREERARLPLATMERDTPAPMATAESIGDPVADPASVHLDVEDQHPGLDLDLAAKKLEEEECKDACRDAEEDFKEKTPRIFQLFITLFEAMISRSELLCYFAMILNHLVSASLLSLPYPVSVFLWAMLSVPRPTKTYWVTIITYTEAVVVVKYLFQFGFFPWNDGTEHDEPFWPPTIIGIQKNDFYAAYDLFLLVCLFVHRSVLKRNGLWKDAEDADADLAKAEHDHEISRQVSPASTPSITSPVTETFTFKDEESLKQAEPKKAPSGAENEVFENDSLLDVTGSLEDDGADLIVDSSGLEGSETTKKKKRKRRKQSPGADDEIPEQEEEEEEEEEPSKVKKTSKETVINESENEYWETDEFEEESIYLPPEHYDWTEWRYDMEKEYLYTVLALINSVCAACWQPVKKFYAQMTNPKFNAATDVYALMFLCDFINFFIIVFGYKSFGPSPFSEDKTGETSSSQTGTTVVTAVLQENKVPVPFLIMLLLQFVLIIIDRALYLRKQVIGKFLYQILLVGLIHLWMFFILPAITQRRFTDNIAAQLWYFVKCIYFGLSAYQIRSGYPTRILGNFLTKKYNYVNLFLFKGFLVVPFLLELRALMDWIWTDTTLALTSWLEMEDIYANIFQLKCWRRAEEAYPTPRGQLRKLAVKYGMGGLILFLLIFIIWFPLLLFSLADTVLYEENPPISCDVQIALGGYQPIFQMSAQQQSIKMLTDAQFKYVTAAHQKSEATAFLSSYKASDVSRIEINGESIATWSISPPSMDALCQDLRSNNDINLIFTITFDRSPKAGLSSKEVTAQFVTVLDPDKPDTKTLRHSLADMINNTSNATLDFKNIFPRYIRVPAGDKPQNVTALVSGPADTTNVSLRLERTENAKWWEVTEYTNRDIFNPDSEMNYWPFISIVAFNDRVAPAGLSFFTGYGIIGLYVSLVLVVGRFVRLFFSGLSTQVMFQELPNVDKVLKLCLDVYMVREVRELSLEEELFAKLLFIYRSPATLIKWTRQKLE